MDFSARLPAPIRRTLAAVAKSPLWQLLFGLAVEFSSDDAPGLAAEMAYRFVFALFPFLIFLAAFFGFVGAHIGQAQLFSMVVGIVTLLMPPEVQQVVDAWVKGVLGTRSPGLLTFGAAGALWGAAGGVGTLVKGLNRAYDVAEDRSWWKSHVIALSTTFLLALVMLGGLGLFAFGDWLIQIINEYYGLNAGLLGTISALQRPVIAVGLEIVLVLLYTWLPNTEVSIRESLPGAALAGAGWLAITLGFSSYIDHFGSFDRTFGSLGAAVMLMFWMYVLGLVLMLGGELNATLAGRKTEPLGRGAPANPHYGKDLPGQS